METRIVFMGTPEFAVPILRALVLDLPKNYRVVGVVTQPDKKVGRKQILTPSPIKEESALYNIPVFQPKKIKEEYQAILDLKTRSYYNLCLWTNFAQRNTRLSQI